MKKIKEIIVNLSIKLIWVLFGIIVFWLFIVCGNVTARIDLREHTYLIKDSMFENIGLAVWTFLLLLLCNYIWETRLKRKVDKADAYKLSVHAILILIGAIGAMMVFVLQNNPRSDQYSIMECASQLKNHDFSCFETEGYLDRYPNQYGLVLIVYLFSFIFGDKNYVVFQLVNVLALVMFYKLLEIITGEIYGHKTSLLFVLSGVLFLPLTLYVNFVYGTLIGLTCSLAALYFLYKYNLSDNNGENVRNLLLSVLLCSLSIWVKNNYMIFAIGLIIYSIITFLRNTKMKQVLAVLGTTSALILGIVVPGAIMGKLADVRSDSGVSTLSYVAMGLQENDRRYDGWYNKYNKETYEEADFSNGKQAKVAREYLMTRIDDIKKSPQKAISFFSGKNASQWANPDFQGFWVNKVMPHKSELVRPDWAVWLFSFRGSETIFKWLNFLQFWIISGTLIYVLLRRENDEYLYLMSVVTGGFIFHSFWEAKAEYTLSYFALLLPVAANGWISIVETFAGCVRTISADINTEYCKDRSESKQKIFIKRIHKLFKKNRVRGYVLLALEVIVVLHIIRGRWGPDLNRVFALDKLNDIMYESYIRDNVSAVFNDREYYISSLEDCSVLNAGESLELSDRSDANDANIMIESYGDLARIHFTNINKYLNVSKEDDETDAVGVDWGNKTSSQLWFIKENEDGTYIIMHDNNRQQTLTMDTSTGRVFLSQFREDDENQMWNIY